MTAKQFVLQHYPKARSEKQKTMSNRVYWLIREKGASMYISDGNTEIEAWENASKRILSQK